MNGLLDTHGFLWSLFDPEKLSKPAAETIKAAENDVPVSMVNSWEISLKYGLGKLELFGVEPDELPEISGKAGFVLLPMRAIEASTFRRLPRLTHGDPFDRFIIWQAIQDKMTLVSVDSGLKVYRDFGLKSLW